MEGWGYLTRTGDDVDGRGRVVHLTERGFALVALLRETLEEIEAGLRARCGDAAVATFLAVLDEVGPVTDGARRAAG